MDSTTSLASGCAERMNDSVQQVHSRPCSQMTGVRGLVSSAFWICCAPASPSPSDAAVRLQNLTKLRRVMPCRRITSYDVSSMVDSPRVFEFRDEGAGLRTVAIGRDARMLFLCAPLYLMKVNRVEAQSG